MNLSPSAVRGQLSAYRASIGLALLLLLYLLPGLVSHDPWRGEDVRSFSIVLGMLNGDGLLFPQVAGEPSAIFPPFYYWISSLFALSFGWLLTLHDAARLASAFFAGLAVFWITQASRRLYGKQTGIGTGLLALGTLGLVIPVHEMQPTIALIAMQSLALAGLSRIAEQPLRGCLEAATGTALAFLSAGPIGLVLTLPLFLVLAATCPACRTSHARRALILGFAFAIGLCALWPVALHLQDPVLTTRWLEDARATLSGPEIRSDNLFDLLELLGWFLWPLWPIAMWAVWRGRRNLLQLSMILPLAAITSCLCLVYFVGPYGPIQALPLIPGFALLAGSGIPILRRGAANAFDWFALTTFAVFAALVWLAWTAQVIQWPPGLARSVARNSPDFVLQGTETQVVLGSIIMLVWVILVWRLPRFAARGPTNWAMGMTMLWCLAVTLLLPWFNNDRSYRDVSESLRIALGGEAEGCVASMGLTTSHRASLDYFASLRTQAVTENGTQCPYLLVREDARSEPFTISPDWKRIWQDRHGGGKRLETFSLYRRE